MGISFHSDHGQHGAGVSGTRVGTLEPQSGSYELRIGTGGNGLPMISRAHVIAYLQQLQQQLAAGVIIANGSGGLP